MEGTWLKQYWASDIKIMFHQDLNILVAIYLLIYGTDESSLLETNFMLMWPMDLKFM